MAERELVHFPESYCICSVGDTCIKRSGAHKLMRSGYYVRQIIAPLLY